MNPCHIYVSTSVEHPNGFPAACEVICLKLVLKGTLKIIYFHPCIPQVFQHHENSRSYIFLWSFFMLET